MDERSSDILPQERAGEGGGEVEIARKGGRGGTETGGVRAALGEDRGSNEAGGDRKTTMGDPERGEMGVTGVYGIREVEHGGSIMGFQSAGRKETRAEEAAAARNEVGRVQGEELER